MNPLWTSALWQQFGAAIDMLDNAISACPPETWRKRIWGDPATSGVSAEFWSVTFHTLFWLDLYLSGTFEGFAPPPPFTMDELTDKPAHPYTKDELRTYLAFTRQKCHATIAALSDETAARPFDFPWNPGYSISFLELLLYTMRHVQEHAAHLSLFLGQNGVADADLDWVSRAKASVD